MSEARRAYDILRGYVNYGWDHVAHREESDAEQELRTAIATTIEPSPVPVPSYTSSVIPSESAITLDQARKLFEVSVHATSQQITQAYDELRMVADPSRFSEGSSAFHRARLLMRRLDAARNLLMENIDPTVRRFERLEIE
jgi:hypothetical protein